MKDIRIKLFSPHSTDTSSVTLWNCSVSAKASERAYRQMKLNIQFPLYNESSITRLLAAHKRPINANENWNIKKKNSDRQRNQMKSNIIRNAANKSQIISLIFFQKLFFFLSFLIPLILLILLIRALWLSAWQQTSGRKLSASIRKFENWLKIAGNILNYHVRIIVIIFNFAFYAVPFIFEAKFFDTNRLSILIRFLYCCRCFCYCCWCFASINFTMNNLLSR